MKKGNNAETLFVKKIMEFVVTSSKALTCTTRQILRK